MMTDDNIILLERYKLGEEMSRNTSTVTYKGTDLRLGQREIQIVILTDGDQAAIAKFQRNAHEAARGIGVEGEWGILDLACAENGNYFAVYGKAGSIKLKNSGLANRPTNSQPKPQLLDSKESEPTSLADVIRKAVRPD